MREYAVHIRHRKTLEHRIVKTEAETVNHAFCEDAGSKKDWIQTGAEPRSHIEKKVTLLDGNYYKYK